MNFGMRALVGRRDSRYPFEAVTALRVPDGKHGALVPGRRVPVAYLPADPSGTTLGIIEDSSAERRRAELQLAPAVTVTPFAEYADAPDLAGSGAFNFGVRANYWVDSQWAVTAGIERDDDQNTSFTVGTNFRF